MSNWPTATRLKLLPPASLRPDSSSGISLFSISSPIWKCPKLYFSSLGLAITLLPQSNYLNLAITCLSQITLEHHPCWAVGGKIDGCVKVKSSLAPWDGQLAGLWVMVVCRVPQSREMKFWFILQRDSRYWRTGWGFHQFPPKLSQLLPLELEDVTSFPIPVLHPLLPQ